MIVPIPRVHSWIGAVLALVSLPLALRLVPMNHLYGVRIPKAFVSEQNWYEINAYGGRWLFASGVFLLVIGYVGRAYAPPPTSMWAPAYLIGPLLVLIPALIAIVRFAARLPDR